MDRQFLPWELLCLFIISISTLIKVKSSNLYCYLGFKYFFTTLRFIAASEEDINVNA